jgi:carboxyl-terminal processing protease
MIEAGLDQDPAVDLAKTYLTDPGKMNKTLAVARK